MLYTIGHSEVYVFSYCINIITSSLQTERGDYLPLTGVELIRNLVAHGDAREGK